jgi:O-antigen ligase
VLLLAAVVGLPWFWGGVWMDAYRTAAAFIALAAGWALMRQGSAGLGLGPRTAWLLPAFLLGAFAFAQTLPLPRAWIAGVSPKAAALQADAFGPEGLTGEAWLRWIEEGARERVPEASAARVAPGGELTLGPEAPAPPRRFTLSLAPDITREKAFWYTTLLLAFLLAHRRAASERRASVYRAVLFVFFTVLALVAILGRATAPGRLLWLRDAPFPSRPFGPYVNPNHFAGAMELAVPWLLGYGLAGVAGRRSSAPPRAARAAALAGALIGAAGTLLAASKAAAVTTALTSLTLLAVAIVARRGHGRSKVLRGAALTVVLLGAVAAFGPMRGRIAEFNTLHEVPSSDDVRLQGWSAGLRMAHDFVWAGSGFGAFSELVPAYLPRGESELWAQLHNDYLEVFLAGGVIAAALVVWLAAAFGVRLFRAVRTESRNGRLLPALGLALGLVALAVHEAVDFNLQMPANALLFVAIAAIAVAPAGRTESHA